MVRFRLPVFALGAIGMVAACDGNDPVASGANDASGLPAPVNDAAPTAQPEPPANAAEASTAEAGTPGAGRIPVALHGRWGLTPGDCTSTRGDAKGLLTISADKLRFYESVAVPTGNLKGDADSISGDFSFTGEGQSWTKFQMLQLRKNELIRTETNPAASFTYAKCT